MGNAEHDTPVGRPPPSTSTELEVRVLAEDVARVQGALGAMVVAAEQSGGADVRALSSQVAELQREIGDLGHETARHFEALARADAATRADLSAVRQVVGGVLRWSHVGGFVVAAALMAFGVLTGSSLLVGPVAGGIVTVVGDSIRRGWRARRTEAARPTLL